MNRNEKFIYINERGNSIDFSLWSDFLVDDVDGISGLRNNIYNSKGMNQDGSSYISSSLDSRNVVISGNIKGNKEQNRIKLLRIINPKLKGKLIYDNGVSKKFIDCIVEKAPLITKEKIPKFQLSLLAHNPYWLDINESKETIAIWKGAFHFPLTLPTVMGKREPSLIVNVFNPGDVETGMKIEFTARGSLRNPSLFNVNTREYIKINKHMAAGEKIVINTNFGKKKIESILNGVTTDILNYIDLSGGNTFLQLDIGDNLFRYDADENLDHLEANIYFNPQYVGV